jgi:hypothetical protein
MYSLNNSEINLWQVVVFMVNGKANHVGLSIPDRGLADLSLLGARIVSWDATSLPKGEQLHYDILIPMPNLALGFLEQAAVLTFAIIDQEKAYRGWHLTKDAPDFVRRLRHLRSRDINDMNCVEWIVRSLEVGGIEMPDEVLTPTELLNWCRENCSEAKQYKL